jgi:hypothetical protein
MKLRRTLFEKKEDFVEDIQKLIQMFNTYPKCMSTVNNSGTQNVCLTGAALMVMSRRLFKRGGVIQKSLDNIK